MKEKTEVLNFRTSVFVRIEFFPFATFRCCFMKTGKMNLLFPFHQVFMDVFCPFVGCLINRFSPVSGLKINLSK